MSLTADNFDFIRKLELELERKYCKSTPFMWSVFSWSKSGEEKKRTPNNAAYKKTNNLCQIT